MFCSKMGFEIFPSFLQNILSLPLFACIYVYSGAKYKCICNVDDLLSSIWLLPSLCVCTTILHLFEEVFNGVAGVVWLSHAFIVVN
jgi:hypothetical protein